MFVATRVRPLKRRHIQAMTPVTVEFLSLLRQGRSVLQLCRHFGWHPLAVVAAKRNLWHCHKLSW
jgi:hypothetical protein